MTPRNPDAVSRRVREHLLDEHRATVAAVVDAADAVAAGWEGGRTADRDALVDALERGLGDRGLLDRFPSVIVDVADVAGFDLPAAPVAGPPYVAVTSTGPILRATVGAGRLVVSIRVFAVERGDPTRYRRRGDDPADVLDVAFRRGED